MTAREIHHHAELAREKDQDFIRSLELTDQALVIYLQEGNLSGAAEVQCSRFITFKHLYSQNPSPAYDAMARHAVLTAVEISNSQDNPTALAIPYFSTGKYYEEFPKDFSQAVTWYSKAVDAITSSPPPTNDREAVKVDFRIHLAFAQGMSGDQQSLSTLESLAQILSTLDEDQYNRDVWVSGAYMRLARLAHNFQLPEKVTIYLNEADQVANANPELTLRRRQLSQLRISLGK